MPSAKRNIGICLGEDYIPTEIVKIVGKYFKKSLKKLPNKCLHETKILPDWYNAEVVTFYRNGVISTTIVCCITKNIKITKLCNLFQKD